MSCVASAVVAGGASVVEDPGIGVQIAAGPTQGHSVADFQHEAVAYWEAQ